MFNRSGQAERNIGSRGTVPKLPSFDEKIDDLDTYLYRFEGYATMQGWPKERWESNLSALLKEHIEDKTTSLLVHIYNRIRILVMLQFMRLNISYQLYVITKISAIISRYLRRHLSNKSENAGNRRARALDVS